MQDIQRRRIINALSSPVTPAERRATAVSNGCQFGHLCVLVAIAAGLAAGLVGPAEADTTNASEFDLAIRNHALARPGNVIRVHMGDVVRLRWTTDATMTIHLHGYDIESEHSPDAATVMSFEAHAIGRFPVNLHGGHDHGEGGTLLYLEVLPR